MAHVLLAGSRVAVQAASHKPIDYGHVRSGQVSRTAFQTTKKTKTEDDTVQQIADLFSVPRTTVYGDLSDASKGERPTIHRNR